jgi:hypothetical protein
VAEIRVEEPEQIDPLFTLTIGVVVTFTISVFVSLHVELLPVTVYIVVAAGERVCVPPLRFPGFQENAAAPLTVSTV